MARRPNSNPNKLTEAEEKFAYLYAVEGKTRADAEREAGYTSGTSTRLLRRAAVMNRIIGLQRAYVVTWKRLLVKAQHSLDDILDNGNELAAVLLNRLAQGGQITALELKQFLKTCRVTPADRNTAARLVMESMSKINPKSLSDAAESEDKTMSRDQAIAAMLGSDADETSEGISQDAPPDPDAPEDDDIPESEVTH